MPNVASSLISSDEKVLHRAIATLQRLSELFYERRSRLAREAGLTVEQWRMLEGISEEHFMPSMFAKARDCSAAAVSKVLRQLLERGLVEVFVSADGDGDGRRRKYRLTADGRRTMTRLRASRERAIEAIWSEFRQSELEHFAGFGSELAQRMEKYSDR